MSSKSKSILLKSRVEIPLIGCGTDGFTSEEAVAESVSTALTLGHSLIDTAAAYAYAHPAIATAITKFDRSKVFICSKFNLDNVAKFPENAEAMVKDILTELGIDQLDLLLMHNPIVPNFSAVFNQLIALKGTGLFRALGVSNFTIRHLKALGSDIHHVDVNQIEMHAHFVQPELRVFCAKTGIQIMAYRALCQGAVLGDPTIQKIALKHHKTPAQVALRWLTQRGIIAVAKSSIASQLQENLQSTEFDLTADELAMIDTCNKNVRTCTGPWADFD